jgi:hypothetical protein
MLKQGEFESKSTDNFQSPRIFVRTQKVHETQLHNINLINIISEAKLEARQGGTIQDLFTFSFPLLPGLWPPCRTCPFLTHK